MTASLERLWRTLLDGRQYGFALLAGIAGAVLLIMMARPVLDHVPLYDELLHVLAARGVIETGEPSIAGGYYYRSELYTRLAALAMSHFGDTVVSARLPSLIAGAALVLLLAVWVTRLAGLLAGAASALFLCAVPTTLEMSVFARFYTLHALAVCAMAILVFAALARQRTLWQRIALVVAALALAALAYHLQDTTLIAVGALIAGAMGVVIHDNWPPVRAFIVRRPVLTVVALFVLLVGGSAVVVKVGLFALLRQAPAWVSWAADRPYEYLVRFADNLPLLWPLFPVALVFALRIERRLTIFCAALVLSALVVHSIAAAKSLRYLYYIFPPFCAILGCGLAGALKLLTVNALPARQNADAADLKAVWIAFGWLALVAVMFVNSHEGQRVAKAALGRSKPAEVLSYAVEPEWRPAVPTLQPLVSSADRVVTSNAMKSLFYFGRYDYELNASIVPETQSQTEFGTDERTGKQAIGEPASIAEVIDMPGSTVVVLEQETIGGFAGVSSQAVAEIAARCKAVPLAPQIGLSAWTCHEVAAAAPTG